MTMKDSRVSIKTLLASSPIILGEGAVIERLRRSAGVPLDPQVVNSAFIYTDQGRIALESICRQYIDIGCSHALPMLISTPTWRASRERIAAAGFAGRDLNGDNFRFLNGIRQSYGDYAGKVAICGLMSCRGDAYRPDEALAVGEAREFHSWQAGMLAASGVDFLLASTLPAITEATGLAHAMAETGCQYVVSFVVRPEGTLLDGTPLKEAIAAIDELVSPPPVAYLVNCTHASVFRRSLLHESNSSQLVRERVAGLLANTAPLSPEELDNSSELIEEEPDRFGSSVAALYTELGMRILGGCCGTDDRHISSLADELVRRSG